MMMEGSHDAEFVEMVRALRELGAVKVRSGDREVVFATLPKPEAPAVPVAPTEPANAPVKREAKPHTPDIVTEEQRRIAQLREELEN